MTSWPALEWDGHGYPEEASIEAIRALPLNFNKAGEFVRNELTACAEVCCASYEEETADDGTVIGHFSTGGWSGAESLMGLIESRFDASYFMMSWRRGGHYTFEFKPIAASA